MKIVAIDVCPLTGGTVDGGWPQGHEPQENLHTLLIVRTDAGSGRLRELLHVGKARGRGRRAALAAAARAVGGRAGAGLRDAPPVELLARAGRLGRARDQRHRHRPLGPDGQGLRPAGLATAGRQLPADDQAVRVDPVRRARAACAGRSRASSSGVSRRSSWAGGRSAAATASSTSCWCGPPARRSATTSS